MSKEIYIAVHDSGDGSYLGTVGPFENRDAVNVFMDHPQLKDNARHEETDINSPDEFITIFFGEE